MDDGIHQATEDNWVREMRRGFTNQPLTPSQFVQDELCPENASYLCVVGIDVANMEVLQKLASRFKKDRFKFMYFDSADSSALAAQFRVAADIKSGLAVYNRKRSKMAARQGSDEATFRTFLETILSGSGSFKRVDV